MRDKEEGKGEKEKKRKKERNGYPYRHLSKQVAGPRGEKKKPFLYPLVEGRGRRKKKKKKKEKKKRVSLNFCQLAGCAFGNDGGKRKVKTYNKSHRCKSFANCIGNKGKGGGGEGEKRG